MPPATGPFPTALRPDRLEERVTRETCQDLFAGQFRSPLSIPPRAKCPLSGHRIARVTVPAAAVLGSRQQSDRTPDPGIPKGS